MFDLYGDVVIDGVIIKNITERFKLVVPDRMKITQDYLIVDWESPEIVSYKMYDTCDYEWAVLLANDIINPFADWLLSEEEIQDYIEEVYGDSKTDIHHYEFNGLIYSPSFHPIDADAISNYEYLYDRNEKKRKIQVIVPSIIEDVKSILLSQV